jgi:hypothetical protein
VQRGAHPVTSSATLLGALCIGGRRADADDPYSSGVG